MSINILKNDIKNHSVGKIYLFYGIEEYLKEFYLEQLENIVLSDSYKELNKIILKDDNIEKIIEACETYPIFSKKKLVVVKDSGLFKGSKTNSSASQNTGKKAELTNYLKNLPDYTCLIFYEKEVDKRLTIVNSIKNNGLVVEFPLQASSELCQWIINNFKKYNKKIDKQAALKLLEYSDQTMYSIIKEIDKLILYVDQREQISIQDIEAVCTKSINVRIFDLMDAISAKSSKKSFELLNELIDSKEHPSKIFYMISKHIKQMLEIKTLSSKYQDFQALSQKMGLSLYIVKKISRQLSSFSYEQLKNIYEKCYYFDNQVKTGRADIKTALEVLLCEIV